MRYKSIIFAVICILALSGCSVGNEQEALEEAEQTVYAMDTVMTLQAYGANANDVLNKAADEITRLDNLFRRGSEDSEIYKINTQKSAEVSEDTANLIKSALEISKSTDGVFDISIAPVMDLWGFYEKDFYVPTDFELANVLSAVDYNNISVDGSIVTLDGETKIDLGGIAKGFASNRIMEIFKENQIQSGLVSLGGNVQAIGKKTDGSMWKVGIQNPDDNSYIGALSVSDKAVITSGGYQRYFEADGVTYHHIIDPNTGYPAESGLKSVTIVSEDGTLADGLSTSLFIMGLENGTEYWREHEGFDVIFYTDDNMIYITEGIKDDFESVMEYTVIEK